MRILKSWGKFKKAVKQESNAEYKKNKLSKTNVTKEKKGKRFYSTKDLTDLLQNNLSSVASFSDKLLLSLKTV